MKNINRLSTAAKLRLLTAAIIAASASQMAFAQLEEIIVFAQKTESNLQETPVAVTAFTEETFEDAGLVEIADIQRLTPNFFVQDRGTLGGSFSGMTIRGQSSGFFTLNADQAVGVYIDGAPITRGTAISSNLFDIEQVEVLKGPQGTLYGKNTTGGAINIRTRAPELGEFGGFAEVTAGDFGQVDLKGALNIPMGDITALRISAAKTERDGFGEGFSTGQDLADDNETIIRGSLLIEPNSDLSVRLNASHHEVDEMNSIFRYLSGGTVLVDGDPGVNFYTGNDIDQDNENTSETTSFSMNINANLGEVTLDSITSYREQEAVSNQQIISFTPTYLSQDSEFLSQELRLSGFSASDNLFWQAGVFYSDESGEDADFLPGLFFVPSFRQLTSADNQTFAIFGQASFDFNERLSGHLGLRYTEEERDIASLDVQVVADGGDLVVDGNQLSIGGELDSASADFDDISWSTGLDYKFADNVFGYVTIAEGFKSGALDQDNIGIEVPAETVLNYEVGLKADLLDNKLRINLAAFLSDYEDIQRVVSVPAGPTITTAFASAEEATISGLELELTATPTENLSLGATVGILDASYDTFFDTVEVVDPVTMETTLEPRDRSGDSFRAPELQTSAFIRYEKELTSGNEFGFGVNYFHQGESDFSTVQTVAFDDSLTVTDSYDLLNIQADLTLDESMKLSIFANNVTDEDYFTTGFAIFPFASAQPGDPRTYGVRVRYDF